MYQKLIFIGNLGRDPEMRYLPNGKAVTNLSVATNRVYNDSNGQKVTETTWFKVNAWGALAETTNQYLRKGSKVLVEGHLNPDPETGGPKIFSRNDGTAGTNYEMTAQRVVFLSSHGEDQAYQSPQQDQFPDPGGIDEDDIPF